MTFSFSFVLEKEGIMYEELSLNIEAQKKHVRFSYVDMSLSCLLCEIIHVSLRE